MKEKYLQPCVQGIALSPESNLLQASPLNIIAIDSAMDLTYDSSLESMSENAFWD